MPEPPKDFQALKDFRRLPGTIAGISSPELSYEIRAAQERREIAISLYEDLNESIPIFDLTSNRRENPDILAKKIREYLKVSYELQGSWRDARIAYNAWRNLIEKVGVLVFQAYKVSINEMRGFAIADKILPVIAVNSKDSPSGRTFSLLHEFYHLILGESALTDFSLNNADTFRPPEVLSLEIYCNKVAAASLLPKEYFLNEPIIIDHGTSEIWKDDELNKLAKQYSVSPEAVLRRLLTFNMTSQSFYDKKRIEFIKRYELLAEKQTKKGAEAPLSLFNLQCSVSLFLSGYFPSSDNHEAYNPQYSCHGY